MDTRLLRMRELERECTNLPLCKELSQIDEKLIYHVDREIMSHTSLAHRTGWHLVCLLAGNGQRLSEESFEQTKLSWIDRSGTNELVLKAMNGKFGEFEAIHYSL